MYFYQKYFMKTKFNLSMGELVELYMYSSYYAPWRKQTFNKRLLIFTAIYAILGIVFLLEGQYSIAIAFIILGIIWYFLYPVFYVKRLENYAKHHYNQEVNKRFFLENTYTFSPSHFEISNELIEAKCKWNSIVNIMERENAFWLFETLSNAHIIPKRALSEKDEKEFKDLLNKISGQNIKVGT